MTCTSPVDLSSSIVPCCRLDQGRPRCSRSHLAVASRRTPTPPNAFTRGIQRPTPNAQHHPTPSPEASNAQHPTPNTTQRPTGGPCNPTPKSVDTQRPKLNTQRPKFFFRFAVSSHICSVGALLRPRGVFREWGAARGSRTLPFGGGGGEVGVGSEVGGGGEV